MSSVILGLFSSIGVASIARFLWNRLMNTTLRFWELRAEKDLECLECTKFNRITGESESMEMLRHCANTPDESYRVLEEMYSSRSDTVKRRVIVAFGESNITSNLLGTIDLRGRTSQNYVGSIYAPYLETIDTFYESILSSVKKHGGKPVYVAGWSSGGALALLFVARARRQTTLNIKRLYTFGAPRVGDKKFSEWCDYNFRHLYHRWVNGSDPIPRLPISLTTCYKHCGRPHYAHRSGDIEIPRLYGMGDEYMPLKNWLFYFLRVINGPNERFDACLERHTHEQYNKIQAKTHL